MLRHAKRPVFLIPAIIIILAGWLMYWYATKPSAPTYMTTVAKVADVVQEVNITGKVKPAEDVSLSFEKAGKVRGIQADVGDVVALGAPLASLDTSELMAAYDKAVASLDMQDKKLDELKKGTRPEEITIYETKLDTAHRSQSDAAKNLADKVSDAYTKIDDAVRAQADQLFTDPRSGNPKLLADGNDNQLKIDIENGRIAMENKLVVFRSTMDQSPIERSIDTNLKAAKESVTAAVSFLDKIALFVNGLSATSQVTSATISTWKTNISAARASVNLGASALSAAEEKYRASVLASESAINELNLKRAGATSEQVAVQEAAVSAAEAEVTSVKAGLSKMSLFSPIAGTITKRNIEVGEIVSPGTNVFSIISTDKMEVTADVPEVDIAKLAVSDNVSVTLDPYGSDVVFGAVISKIDPAETVIDGVPTYKVTLNFTTQDPRIKSGMTANIDVKKILKNNAILIPHRAVTQMDGDKTVEITNQDGTTRIVNVKTGLRSSNGEVEILEGVSVGDKIVLRSGVVK